MNYKQRIQNAILMGLFFSLVGLSIYYRNQSVVLEFISNTLIVIGLLGFSETIFSMIIRWPVYLITKTYSFIKSN